MKAAQRRALHLGVLIALLAGVLLAFAAGGPAAGEVKDYEIIRFLYLKTSCGRSMIVKTQRQEDKVLFWAECQDKTSFPDGAIVVCTDAHDDRSCTLSNAPTEFRNLRLLEPPP